MKLQGKGLARRAHAGPIAVVALLALLVSTACARQAASPAAALVAPTQVVLPTDGPPCAVCAQATLDAAGTQLAGVNEQVASANQELMRSYQLATANAATSTPSPVPLDLPCAVCAQATLDAAATQVAGVNSEVAQANQELMGSYQLATAGAGTSTQVAVVTQVALQQAQARLEADGATRAAGQTATAQAEKDAIATQTQAAVARGLWYAAQDRQLAEQARQLKAGRDAQIAGLGSWVLLVSILVAAGVFIWSMRRWLKTRETRQASVEQPASRALVSPSRAGQVGGWLEDVKHELLAGREDDDVNPGV
jgi:ATP/maltotriose-dependent transcriptional regulator MalT